MTDRQTLDRVRALAAAAAVAAAASAERRPGRRLVQLAAPLLLSERLGDLRDTRDTRGPHTAGRAADRLPHSLTAMPDGRQANADSAPDPSLIRVCSTSADYAARLTDSPDTDTTDAPF